MNQMCACSIYIVNKTFTYVYPTSIATHPGVITSILDDLAAALDFFLKAL